MSEIKGKSRTGGCMCGQVRFRVTADSFLIGYCHCRSCRHHTGAPVAAMAGFKRDQVIYTKGEPRLYRSSPGVVRAFCDQCGTPLTWEAEVPEMGPIIDIHINTFDDPEALVPQLHLHHGEHVPWFEIADDLPRYRTFHRQAEPYQQGPTPGPDSRRPAN